MDMNQAESLKVVRAPVPGALPLKETMASRRAGEERVMVKDSHCDSGTRLRKFWGLPVKEAGSLAARLVQRVQAGSVVVWVRDSGAELVVPREEEETMLPLVTKTRSLGSRWMTLYSPLLLMCNFRAVNEPGSWSKSMSDTVMPFQKSTSWSLSQVAMGRMRESNWL